MCLFLLVCHLTIHIFPYFSVNIKVDVVHPERNREVFVFHFKDKVDNQGVLHNGFAVEMDLDIRDFREGLYSAELVSSTEIMIKAPGQPATYTLDFLVAADAEAKGRRKCENLHQARNVARNGIQDDPDRCVKHIILAFPSHIKLSNTIYSSGLPTGMIKMEILPTQATLQLSNGKSITLHRNRAVWKVHVVEDVVRKVQSTPSTKTNLHKQEMADLDAYLAGMTM
jgi:hypothetical protein